MARHSKNSDSAIWIGVFILVVAPIAFFIWLYQQIGAWGIIGVVGILAALIATGFAAHFHKEKTEAEARTQRIQRDLAEIEQKLIEARRQGTAPSPRAIPQQTTLNDFEWVGGGDAVSANLRLQYQDAAGNVTERTVEVKSFTEHPSGGIEAFCHLRQSRRSFYYHRMQKVVDLDSGEVIDEPWAWLDARRRASPDFALSENLSAIWPELEVLVYVCRADGRMMAPERALVVSYMQKRKPELSTIPVAKLEKVLKDDVANLSPAQFKHCVAQCRQLDEEVRSDLVSTAVAVVATQSSVAEAEDVALDYLHEKLLAHVEQP